VTQNNTRKPVVLFSFYDWGLRFGVERLYSALRSAGFQAQVICFGHPVVSDDLEERLLIHTLGQDPPILLPGPTAEEIDIMIETIRRFDPLLIGMSVLSAHYPVATRISRALKAEFNVPLVWGGMHPTFLPEESLRDSGADAVCRGEGEEALVEMARITAGGSRDFSKLENLCVLDSDGGFILNPLRPLIEPLDRIPFIAIADGDLVQIRPDPVNASPATATSTGTDIQFPHGVMTSFGCPFRCTFCFNEDMNQLYKGRGRYIRRKSIDRVLEECRYGRDVLGKTYIAFWDDIFTLNQSWLEEFSERYRKEIGLPFYCFLHPKHAPEEVVQMLKEAGCVCAELGIQTGSEKYRKEYFGRKETNEEILEVACRLNRAFRTTYDLIIEAPFETEEDLQDTVNLLLQIPHPFDLLLNNYICIPGCSLTRRALEEGRITDDDLVWKQPEKWDPYTHWRGRRSVRIHNWYLLINITQYPEFKREEIEAWMKDDSFMNHESRLRMMVALRLLHKTTQEKTRAEEQARGHEKNAQILKSSQRTAKGAFRRLLPFRSFRKH